MPYRRRYKRRKTFKRKRVYRKSRAGPGLRSFGGSLRITRVGNVPGVGGFSYDGVLSASAGSSHLVVTTPATVNTFGFGAFSYHVRLQDLPSYTEFTGLYDQYKIVKVVFRIIPFAVAPSTGAAAVSTGGQPACMFHIVTDYDDSSKPAASEAGIASLRQYKTYRSYNPYLYMRRGISRSFTPRVATAAYNGTFTGYKNEAFGWCDCDNPGIQGYGLKGVVETISGGAANMLWFKVESKVYLQMKNPR